MQIGQKDTEAKGEQRLLVSSIVYGLLGLLIGSYLNGVISCVTRGESILAAASHCPACGRSLNPWEQLLGLSFLIRGRRCRQCQALIPWRYPFIELLTGGLFFLTARQGYDLPIGRMVLNLAFVTVLITLTFIDIDTMRLPDLLVLPLLGIGLIGAFLIPWQHSGWQSLLSALGAGGLFWLISYLYPEGMGLGDVKFVAALGAFLGFPDILLAIFLASFTGTMTSAVRQKLKSNQQLPFGPYLAFGSLVALFWGNSIFALYWGFVK